MEIVMRTGRARSRGTAVGLLVGGAILVGPAPAPAQTGASDAGTFEILISGYPAGTEEFTIQQTGIGENAEVVATGRIQLSLSTGTIELAPRLRASGFAADPVAYEVTVGGTSPHRIVGQIGSGRFSARITSPSGEQMREYVASSGATVLDDGVAHHYYFLAQRVRNGTVPILIPRENRQVMATVEDLGEERVEVRGQTLTLYHLVVRPAGGEERHVWVDALNRVIRVDIPDREYRATRTVIPR
jgi:hypothetical protein